MSALAKGAAAGLAGTMVVQILSSGDGGRAVYGPAQLAGRLGKRYLRRQLSAGQRRRYGTIMRWLYGPSWGTVFGGVQGLLRLPYSLAAPGFAASLWLFELSALPLTGATPPLRRWGWRQVGEDGLQAVLFGITVASAMALLDA